MLIMDRAKRISYEIIVAAKHGDSDAMQYVLKYYEPYICHVSKRRKYIDEYNYIEVVDEDIKQQIETKLIMETILHFDINSFPEGEVLED